MVQAFHSEFALRTRREWQAPLACVCAPIMGMYKVACSTASGIRMIVRANAWKMQKLCILLVMCGSSCATTGSANLALKRSSDNRMFGLAVRCAIDNWTSLDPEAVSNWRTVPGGPTICNIEDNSLQTVIQTYNRNLQIVCNSKHLSAKFKVQNSN